jgi:hypothetical protein
MSKSIARVALSVLIGFVLIAAISTSVQGGLGGKLLKTETNSAQSHVVNGLMTNLNHYRSSVSELESARMQSETYVQPPAGAGNGHGCESELRVSPDD